MLILTRDQVRRVDQLAIEQYKFPSIILMEHAGRNAASIIDRSYAHAGAAFVFCGVGNNGGDGCVIARHLHNSGWKVRVLVAGQELRMSPDMRTNFEIIRAMRIDTLVAPESAVQLQAASTIGRMDVVIDALLGTGFQGQLREDGAKLINAVNIARKRATVAIDVPSGLDCDTGEIGGAAIRADLTITFVAAKPGFSTPQGVGYVGHVEVADIGVPRELIEQIAAG